MKTIEQHQETISEARFQLRSAKDEARRDKLRHRITFAQRRIAELTGRTDRPLTDADLQTMTYEEFRARTPLALLEVIEIPERFRDQVAAELSEDRRQKLLHHPGVVLARCSDHDIQAQLETEAAEARAVQEAEAANGKA